MTLFGSFCLLSDGESKFRFMFVSLDVAIAQVVGGSGEGKQPSHFVDPSQLHCLQHPDHLHPPERLLHSFSFPLTDLIPGMPGGPLVHRTPPIGRVLRHMRVMFIPRSSRTNSRVS